MDSEMEREAAQGDILQAIAKVQQVVSVPKDRYNDYGDYKYRSFEDIVAALKQPCADAGLGFFMHDEIAPVGERYYVKATVVAYLLDRTDVMFSVSAYAREADHRKGSDDAQVTGSASTYARKYALCGMFAIEGERDPDEQAPATAQHDAEPPASGEFTAHCRSCGTRYVFASAEQYEAFTANPGCCPAPSWEIEG